MKREKDLAEFRAKNFAILNEAGEIVPCPDMIAWAEWMEANDDGNGGRVVVQEEVEGFWVSTVFLGLNHGFGGKRQLWFETTVFRLAPDGVSMWRAYDCDRYETRAEAIAGHEETCAKVRSGEIGE
jgi:hypothetical protein